jgi:hypothetical protein
VKNKDVFAYNFLSIACFTHVNDFNFLQICVFSTDFVKSALVSDLLAQKEGINNGSELLTAPNSVDFLLPLLLLELW